MSIRKTVARFALFLAAALAVLQPTSQPVWAQQVTADALGRVTDSTGAAIPSAQVKIKNTGTDEVRSDTTDGQGDFTFNILQIGSYTLSVSAPGFKTADIPSFELGVGERRRLDVTLQPGAQSEQIQVTSEAPALQTDSVAIGQTLENQAVQDLPTQGRNLYSLVQLAPGANAGPANGVSSGNRPDDRRQASEVSANGQSDSRNNNLLDGMDNNSREGNIIEVRPSIDAVQELSVLTSSYPAEVGNVAGAVVNVITKSGSNQLHGTAYEYFRNDIFDGKDFFAAGLPKPELRQNQFGGSLGGPIRRDKTFFFADAEEFRKIRGQTTTTTVPTLQEQNNFDFTDNGGDNLGATPGFAPDPAGLAAFKLYPTPTPAGVVNNYTSSPKSTQYQFTADGRVDQHLGPNDSFFARYSYNKADTLTPGLFPAVNGIQPGGNVFGFEGTAHQGAMNGLVDYTHIFTSNLILELKGSYTRSTNDYVVLNQGNNASTTLGIPNINVSPSTTGLSAIYPIGFASVGDSAYEPNNITYNTFHEAGIVSYAKGTHSIKAGASLIRRQATLNGEGTYPTGIFFFLGLPGLESIGISGNAMENVVKGLSLAAQRQNLLVPQLPRFWETGAFVQDDWRVDPKLTLNLGLRYDVFTPQKDAKNRLANLDLTTSQLILASDSDPTVGVSTDYKNFAPRIGFSASPYKNTVVHGAFALAFFPADTQNSILQLNPPYQSSYGASLVSLDSNNPNNPYFIFGNLPAPTSPGTDLSTFAGTLDAKTKNFPSSYIEEFNTSVQQQIGQNVITIAYVGELGRKLLYSANHNIDLPAPSAAPNPQTRAPFYSTLPNVTSINLLDPHGSSSYHALQTIFTRHFSHGLSVNANYTWSHSIDDVAASSYSPATAYGYWVPVSHTYDYANSDLDLRNRFAMTASYSFPFTASYTGIKKAMLNGWQLNGIGYWQSGSPYTIENSNPQINIASTSVVSADRPDRIGSGYVSNPSIHRFFNTADFVPQTFGTAGNSGRNILTGPTHKRVDLSIFRDFPVYEGAKLQFRAESYDISNTPNFDQPNADISSPGVGTISNSLPGSDQRLFQFAVKLLF